MDDLISRQAAIDALRDNLVDPDKAISEHPDDVFNYNSGLLTAVQAILDLPSVEPELETEEYIKDCRNCRHGDYNDHWETYFCYCPDNCNNWDRWEPVIESERKAGNWIFNPVYHEWKCSACECVVEEDKKPTWNFCPNCGAKMKKNEVMK